MNWTQLMDAYDELRGKIHENRKIINRLLQSNKEDQKKLEEINKQIKSKLKDELNSGSNIYQIAKDNFGRIDWRFYKLYSYVRGRVTTKKRYKI